MSDKSSALRAKSDDASVRQTTVPPGRGGEIASASLPTQTTAMLPPRASPMRFGARDFMYRIYETRHYRIGGATMSVPPHLQIAIDGPAASGKTTVAFRLAQALGILYLDTGAMYRALAFLALRSGIDADNESALVRLWTAANVTVTLDADAPLGFRIVAAGAELDEATLQSNQVTAIVSTIAAHARVREAMVRSQREIAVEGPVVMAGRDIGTVVLPFAQVKIFLTASVHARVERRRAQLLAAGDNISEHQLAQEIEERDRLDRERAVSPLVPAPDAHVVDSSTIGIDDVIGEIAGIVERAR